jgi:chemotaxis protein CheX
MKKRTVYVAVNCSRVFEATLKNLISPMADVISVSKEEIIQSLFYRPAGPASQGTNDAAPSENVSAGDVFSEAKNQVAMMLAHPETIAPDHKASIQGAAKPAAMRPVEPDCIIYQLSEYETVDEKLVRHMRRSCAFRDIQILVVALYSELPRAKKLMAEGADEVIVVPMTPDALQRKLLCALEPAGIRMPVITKIINPYISATIDMLSTMAGMKAEKKEVFLKKNYRLFGDISAIMTFTGKVEGEVVVCFEEKLAREIVSRIMSVKPDDLSREDLPDGIGEIVNIIAGNAKNALINTEYTHQIALPTVVFGRRHELSHPGNAPCIVIIFEVNNQSMAVLISMLVKK